MSSSADTSKAAPTADRSPAAISGRAASATSRVRAWRKVTSAESSSATTNCASAAVANCAPTAVGEMASAAATSAGANRSPMRAAAITTCWASIERSRTRREMRSSNRDVSPRRSSTRSGSPPDDRCTWATSSGGQTPPTQASAIEAISVGDSGPSATTVARANRSRDSAGASLSRAVASMTTPTVST